jgi:hypothetical protein
MNITTLPIAILLGLTLMSLPEIRAAGADATEAERKLDQFNTVFTSASKDEADSIPLGNGVTGINLWVEENGDLLF